MKDLSTLLFKVNAVKRMPRAGHVLVAEPFVDQTCYNHGVMSIIDYQSDEGATGVVLNNRTEYTLCDLLDGISSEHNLPVFCGGPTGQDRIFFIHTLGPDVIGKTRAYAPGLYVGGNFDDAIAYLNSGYPTEGFIRFFIGYANWVEGQLEKEIERGAWATIEEPYPPESLLTGAGDNFWHRAVRTLGDNYRPWQLLPRNPVCN